MTSGSLLSRLTLREQDGQLKTESEKQQDVVSNYTTKSQITSNTAGLPFEEWVRRKEAEKRLKKKLI